VRVGIVLNDDAEGLVFLTFTGEVMLVLELLQGVWGGDE